ncbi:hypothetical protein DH2020_003283 [Rehmannia glutinosa]|uniref:RING-type E3 ubiquitin transferase n=1 Tax=Rehmannia glutinosa TaxID=99300 RepID=A0ABR0XL58_REHGL
MKTLTDHHVRRIVSISFFFMLIVVVGAQPGPPTTENGEQYPYARFSPSMAIIIVVLIAALFLMGFFSIYIRHCSDSSGAAGSVRRALSLRARRAAAARGLDPSVIETFPTFTYSEVKDHKIGKGTLECAVCLNEFEEEETLRLLPKCDHVFHPECIDAWLESHVTCPVCRANLAPQPGDDEPAAQAPTEPTGDDNLDRINSRNGNDEIVIQVDENQPQGQASTVPPRSWSIRRPKVLGFAKFRSHSTGHSLVQPGENLERFTLRLPEGVRKEVMDRASLNRTGSCAATTLPREGSTRRDGSNRGGRSYRRIEKSDRAAKSDRWVFFTRGLSMRSPKVVAEAGESSGTSRTPVKMPSFKCLEPKAADETGLFSGEPDRHPV